MGYYIGDFAFDPLYLEHHGILGMKWGVRRYQNKDGTLTAEGMERYRKFKKALDASKKEDKAYEKIYDNPAELKKMSDAYANNLSDDKRKFMFDRDSYKEHGNTFKDWYYDNFGQDSDDSPYKPEELRIASKEFIEAAKDFIGQKEWSQKALSTFQKEMSVASGLDDDYYLYDSQKRTAKKEVNKYLGFDYEKAKEYVDKEDKRAKEKRNLDIVFDSEKGKKVYRQEAKKIWDKMSDNEKKHFIEEAKYFNDIGVSISPFNFFVDNSGTDYMDKIYENVVKRLGLD